MKKAKLNLPRGAVGRLWLYAQPLRHGPPHIHDELEVNLVTRGVCTYLLEGQRYDLRPGTMIWLFPAQPHVLIDNSPDFSMWIGVFTPRMVNDACRTGEFSVLRQRNPRAHFCRPIADEAAHGLDGLCQELRRYPLDSDHYRAGLRYLLTRSWDALRTAGAPERGAAIHPAVEQAVAMIRAPENEKLDLNMLSARCGLSPARLSRVFKQQTGVTLARFRQRQRLDRFLAIYGQGERLTMLTAALRAGFGSYAQFHRVFRQIMGSGPGGYRRRFLREAARGAATATSRA